MSAKHTPGPWNVAMLRASPHWREVRDGAGATVASVTAARDEVEANARLIAAAPELLEALRDMVARVTFSVATEHQFLCHSDDNCEDGCQAPALSARVHALNRARAAIAKARGEVTP